VTVAAPPARTTREIDVGNAALFGAFASAIVGLYAIATAGPVGPVPLLVLALAVVLGAWGLRRGVRAQTAGEAGTLRNGLATFLIALVVVPVHGLATGSWVLAAVDLLVILQANRLFALAQGRAMGQVLLISLLMLLGAAVLTLNVSFLGAVFLFCLVGTWTVVFLTLFDPKASGDDRRVPRALGLLALAAGLAVFVLTCALFAILPRLRFQALQSGVFKTEGVSGFSEEVRLGDIGSVKQDFSPVMRIEVDGPPGFDPGSGYWRGIALDRYAGGRWSVSDPSEQQLSGVRSSTGQLFRLKESRNPTIEQRVTLEPIDVSVLFGLPEIRAVQGDFPFLGLNSTDSVTFRARGYGRTRYTVWSSPVHDDAKALQELRAAAPDGDARWLEIPSAVKTAIEPLARQLAGEGSDFRRARRVEAALQTWEYSLTQAQTSAADPVVGFLLESKRGWCEQYSSGMVLLLRSLGIPARMANGFHGGDWNPYGKYLLVRKSDAHSWVEVPFEGVGWVTFDPTPGGGRAEARRFGALSRLLDYARRVWMQRIVTYDIADQFALVSAAGDRAQNFTEDLQRRMRRVRLGGGALKGGALALLAAIAAAATVIAWARRPGTAGRRPGAEAERWWRGVERRLAKEGFTRRRGETARELATRAGHADWADLYYEVRFSTRPTTAAQRDSMDRIARLP